MKPMVSVIVPVYNAEQTIRRCVASILDQQFTDLELLLVDDGISRADARGNSVARGQKTVPELLGGSFGLGSLLHGFFGVGFHGGAVLHLGFAFLAGFGESRHEQLDGADGVIVAGDDVVDDIGIAVGVGHGHDRDAQLAAFLHGDVFAMGVDDESQLGQAIHVLDTAQGLFQLLHFAFQQQDFLLLVTVDAAVGEHAFQLLQAFHALLDGNEVGQGAAHPAVGHVVLVGLGGFGGHGFLGLALGTDAPAFHTALLSQYPIHSFFQ